VTSLNQFNRPEHLAKHGADRLTPIVYTIDDNEGMLTSLAWRLGGSNIESRCFQSVEAFLASFDPHQPYNPSDMLDLITRALSIAVPTGSRGVARGRSGQAEQNHRLRTRRQRKDSGCAPNQHQMKIQNSICCGSAKRRFESYT
jgi:hypothetical protein